MTGWADAIENEVLDHFTGNATWTPPTTLYVALFNGDPDDAGVELSAADYARATGSFGAAVDGQASNSTIVDFGQASSDWGQVTHFAIYDALTAGNMQASGALTETANITSGEDVSFPVGDLTLTNE